MSAMHLGFSNSNALNGLARTRLAEFFRQNLFPHVLPDGRRTAALGDCHFRDFVGIPAVGSIRMIFDQPIEGFLPAPVLLLRVELA
jgi:hypothetical protein